MINTNELTLGGIAEQTRKSWAKRIENYDDVPPEYQSFFSSLQQTKAPFPYTIQCPTFEGFLQKDQDIMVCMIPPYLYIVEKNQSMDQALCFAFSKIGHIKYKSILLNSALEISGISHKGVWVTAQMRFNTVSDYMFIKIMETIRQDIFSYNQQVISFPVVDAEVENFKFSNQIQHTLLEGEKPVSLIWQPELSHPLLGIPLPFLKGTFYYRLIFPSHIVMLTDQEFIQIQESGSPDRVNSYGSIWNFAPLKGIEKVKITPDKDGYLLFLVRLKNGDEIVSKYLASKKGELENLKGMIETLV